MTAAASTVTSNATSGAGGYGKGYSVGSSISEGMRAGVMSRASSIAAAAAEVVSRAISAARQKANSHSPSKVMIKEGQNFGEGYAIGIRNMIGLVSLAATHMAGSGIDAIEGMTLNTQALLESVDWDATPVITPVLDLSEVQRGIDLMDTMMVNNQVRAAAHADRIYATRSEVQEPKGDTNIEVHLDWTAGATANQMAQQLADELSLYKATEGR